MSAFLMMPAKLATLGKPFKNKGILKKGYNVMVSVHNITSKILLCDSILSHYSYGHVTKVW